LVSLHWQTSSEENNKGFSIEKSTDGFNFNKIGFVKGAGQSNSILSYSFQDQEANQDHLYYRLNQLDFNGDSHYSNIVYIDQNQLNEKIFSIQYLLNNEGILIEGSSKNMSLKIWNQGGQLIQIMNFIEEINSVNLNQLPKGIYLLEMTDSSGNRQVEKLIWLGE
jgi:hypothetical protein